MTRSLNMALRFWEYPALHWSNHITWLNTSKQARLSGESLREVLFILPGGATDTVNTAKHVISLVYMCIIQLISPGKDKIAYFPC